ncbi:MULTISPECIES: hypothetical protein [unclassified Bradyrhizobium]|uniref:hypothetical protein n=1 Tax=unclassified Bradyrhizobium TaxID=2631580 RepID=UPI001CD3236D|nr:MULTISPECIES: hypothetical protein [unclassified Bradyrhizobium]MCA1384229.1 hypothetical protein [Bradyrhizobium sp. BRP05]MCA1393552.1 hypothetical protein [Bradyrhizobium sp. IC3123]MCA1420971.1 hypothetical protein [Bradyrhizobium sp. BRP23]MCA1430873.1 hypothetical protein [Bradyrhizobium sp. NBAIM16]MCA1479897.1 hypothetical protein [Bradyrhizobium sp. NBAIM08]
MRVTSSSVAGHVDADLHAAGGKSGGKKGSHKPGERDDHAGSPDANIPVNGGASMGGNSQEAAMQQAFSVALGAVALQFANSAMSHFDDVMAETEEDS